MSRRIIVPALLLVMTVGQSCKNKITVREVFVDESNFKVIQVDPLESVPSSIQNISQIATHVEYIPLETREDNLIGNIDHMEVVDGKYYIFDRLSESVAIFNEDGSFSHKIDRHGSGPHEYLRIISFVVDRATKDVYVYSAENRGVFRYSNSGEFVEKIETSFPFINFEIQDGMLLFYIGRSENNILFEGTYPNQYRYVAKKSDDIVLQQLPYQYQTTLSEIPLTDKIFSRCGDTLLLTDQLEPKIYTVMPNGALKPRYRIEFLNNKYEPKWDELIDVRRMNEIRGTRNYSNIFGNILENTKYIFARYSSELLGLMYVDKADGTIHNLGYFMMDDINNMIMSAEANYLDEEYLYQTADPMLFSANNKKHIGNDLRSKIDKIKESDNPIIVKIKLK